MTSIHNILSSSPLKDYFKEAFNQFVGYGDKKDASTVGASAKTSLLKTGWRLIVLNLNLERHVREIEKKVTDFSMRVDRCADPKSKSELFYEFLDLRFNQWYHASLADFFSMIHYKLLGKLTQKFYGEQSVGVHNVMVQAVPGLISSEPLNDTWDMVEHIDRKEGGRKFFLDHSAEAVYHAVFTSERWESTKILIQNYLKRWGFRCSGELMFFKENYIETPVKFIELVQSYMRNTAQNPRVVIALKDAERRRAMRKFAAHIFQKRHIFLPLSIFETGQLYLVARLCKQAISSRERVRYKQAEMYYKFKVIVRSIGNDAVQKGLLDQAEDVFYLQYKEIGELISSSGMFEADLKKLVALRKETFSSTSGQFFPDSFSTNFGERPEQVSAKVALVEGATEFYGLAASGGRIKARVKVLQSVLEGGKIEKGEILVTKQTDPGWAMIFPLIGGLIVERGGALSHGAIVAREFGIPAVIGIENITAIVKDNDEVILDGDLGKIQLL